MATPDPRLAAWQAWKEATFGTGYMIWHDGLDTGAVRRLRGEARARALGMLRLGIDLGDAHAAEAMAAAGDVSALDAMRTQLASTDGADRVRIALAMHALSPAPALASELVDVVRGHPSWSDRIDAAIGLRHFRGSDDEAALLDAVSGDAEYLVRYHASTSLLVRWGCTPNEIAEHPGIFSDLCGPPQGVPTADDFARYARAREKLAALRPAV